MRPVVEIDTCIHTTLSDPPIKLKLEKLIQPYAAHLGKG
jgi:hypothetical protein